MPSDRKIPVPVTIAIIVLIIFFLARFFTTDPLPSSAAKKSVKNLSLVNASHSQVGIFWQTDSAETGWVIYGLSEKDLKSTASDERDVQNKKNLLVNHYATLKNLQPNTSYFYKIVSDSQVVAAKDGAAFSFKTPSTLTSVSKHNPAYGKIIMDNGLPVENAIVMLSVDKAFSLVALTKTTGEWLIPLNTILNKETMQIRSVGSNEKITVEVLTEDKKTTRIVTNLGNSSPLPQTIILGKNYNFLGGDDVLAVTDNTRSNLKKIEILFPKEGAVIPGNKPLIKGVAIPGNDVEAIILQKNGLSYRTKADKNGLWSIVIRENLAAGPYTLQIRTKSTNGKEVLFVRKFTIAKSGEQVLAAATPEATLTLATSPTEIPTTFPSPTVIFFTPVSTQSSTVSPPVSGIDIVPFGVASASLIILGLGIILAF